MRDRHINALSFFSSLGYLGIRGCLEVLAMLSALALVGLDIPAAKILIGAFAALIFLYVMVSTRTVSLANFVKKRQQTQIQRRVEALSPTLQQPLVPTNEHRLRFPRLNRFVKYFGMFNVGIFTSSVSYVLLSDTLGISNDFLLFFLTSLSTASGLALARGFSVEKACDNATYLAKAIMNWRNPNGDHGDPLQPLAALKTLLATLPGVAYFTFLTYAFIKTALSKLPLIKNAPEGIKQTLAVALAGEGLLLTVFSKVFQVYRYFEKGNHTTSASRSQKKHLPTKTIGGLYLFFSFIADFQHGWRASDLHGVEKDLLIGTLLAVAAASVTFEEFVFTVQAMIALAEEREEPVGHTELQEVYNHPSITVLPDDDEAETAATVAASAFPKSHSSSGSAASLLSQHSLVSHRSSATDSSGSADDSSKVTPGAASGLVLQAS